jgi:hypothetical protein
MPLFQVIHKGRVKHAILQAQKITNVTCDNKLQIVIGFQEAGQ